MSNPTTPFGWQMPTNTDLVTDLPADFEVFGQAVATSMADLLGGTTGQILAKNSNTDMDFVWTDANPGDITGITATSPLTGGGTSGAVTVGIQSASTTQSGAVQLTDSTSSTSTTTAATPNAVKTSYDLAAAAIPKSTVTTSGDVIYATGSSAVTRLGIGTTGQVLTVSGGVPAWSTPASSGAWTTLASGSLSGSGLTLSSISGSYKNLRLVIRNAQFSNSTEPGIRIAGVSTNSYNRVAIMNDTNTGVVSGQAATNQVYTTYNTPLANSVGTWIIDFPDYANTTSTKVITSMARYVSGAAGNNPESCWTQGSYNSTSAISEINFRHTVTFTAGTYILYGEN